MKKYKSKEKSSKKDEKAYKEKPSKRKATPIRKSSDVDDTPLEFDEKDKRWKHFCGHLHVRPANILSLALSSIEVIIGIILVSVTHLPVDTTLPLTLLLLQLVLLLASWPLVILAHCNEKSVYSLAYTFVAFWWPFSYTIASVALFVLVANFVIDPDDVAYTMCYEDEIKIEALTKCMNAKPSTVKLMLNGSAFLWLVFGALNSAKFSIAVNLHSFYVKKARQKVADDRAMTKMIDERQPTKDGGPPPFADDGSDRQPPPPPEDPWGPPPPPPPKDGSPSDRSSSQDGYRAKPQKKSAAIGFRDAPSDRQQSTQRYDEPENRSGRGRRERNTPSQRSRSESRRRERSPPIERSRSESDRRDDDRKRSSRRSRSSSPERRSGGNDDNQRRQKPPPPRASGSAESDLMTALPAFPN